MKPKTFLKFTPALLVALVVCGCCSTNRSALDLSSQMKSEAEFLQQRQRASLDAFTTFTESVETKASSLARTNAALRAKLADEYLVRLKTSVRVKRAELKLGFEQAALAKYLELDRKIELEVDPKVNALIQEAERIAVAAKADANRNPADVILLRSFLTNAVHLERLQFIGATNELWLRLKLSTEIAKARASIYRDIDSTMDDLDQQLSGQKNEGELGKTVGKIREASANSPNISLKKALDQIVEFKAQIDLMHEAHLASIAQLDAYLNRPSGLRLFSSGLFSSLKDKLKTLTPQLGPFANMANDALDAAFTQAEGIIETKSTQLGASINATLANLLNKAIPGLGALATESGTTSSN